MRTLTTILATASTVGLAVLLLRIGVGRWREAGAPGRPAFALRRRRLVQMSLAVSLFAVLVATRRGGWPIAIAALVIVWVNAAFFLRRLRD